MRDNVGFNKWASDYDESVRETEKERRYPFAAYSDVLNEIHRIISKRKIKSILDLGFGTGALTKALYDDGYDIHGVDFSDKMVDISMTKMPNAKLFVHDFSNGLTPEILNGHFDAVISTYAVHHLNDEQKQNLIRQVVTILNPCGLIIFGDIMTQSREELNAAKEKDKDIWDDEEYYVVVDELKAWFPNWKVTFIKKSYCSGVLMIEPECKKQI